MLPGLCQSPPIELNNGIAAKLLAPALGLEKQQVDLGERSLLKGVDISRLYGADYKSVRGLIPDELIDRKKQGFGLPVYEWFTDRLGNYARRELAAFCEKTDFLDRDAVLRLAENRERGSDAWCLLNFALWWKEYIQESQQ